MTPDEVDRERLARTPLAAWEPMQPLIEAVGDLIETVQGHLGEGTPEMVAYAHLFKGLVERSVANPSGVAQMAAYLALRLAQVTQTPIDWEANR